MPANPTLTAHRRLLVTYLRPLWSSVLLLTLLLGGTIALQLLNPQVIRYFIDAAQAGAAVRSLSQAALLFFAVGLGQRVLALATRYVTLNVGWSATNRLRGDLARHCLALDMPFFKTHPPGELIERLDGDVTTLADFFSQLVVRLAGNGLLILAILVLLWREDGRAGVALTLFTVVTLAALAAVHNAGVRRWTAVRAVWAALLGFLEEYIAGTEDIRGVGAERAVLQRLDDLLQRVLVVSRRGRMATALSFVIANFFVTAAYGLGLALGAYLYSQGAVTVGGAFLIVIYIGMLADPLDEIRGQVVNLQTAGAGITRINELFAARPRVVAHGRAGLPDGPLAVQLDALWFRYEDDLTRHNGDAAGAGDHVLQDITLSLPPGRVLGVLGRTGSGKTTLTRLLFRLYDPAAGAICLNGVALRDLPLPELRRRVGMVTQDVQLFQATVRDNITFFKREIGEDRVRRALAQLELLAWVEAMPAGLQTRLATGGQGMSAGESQLLAFARILLRNPGLVILDEAAARLDPITEQRLERAIDRLLAGRTGIIIAHRLHTVRRADDILILEQGRVVEYGPRARLEADPGSRFSRLLQTGLEEALV